VTAVLLPPCISPLLFFSKRHRLIDLVCSDPVAAPYVPVTPRVHEQVKTHAQKYFLKLARQSLEGESGGGGQEGGSDEGPAADEALEKDYGEDGEGVGARWVPEERENEVEERGRRERWRRGGGEGEEGDPA